MERSRVQGQSPYYGYQITTNSYRCDKLKKRCVIFEAPKDPVIACVYATYSSFSYFLVLT